MCKKNKNIATLTVILIVMLTMAACTPEAIIDQPTTDPDTHGGTLIIGNINVGTPASPTAAGTRIGIDGDAFATGDKIKVFADYYDPANPANPTGEVISTYAIYTLQADADGNTWELDAANDPIIVERIMAGTTPIIESWGGMVMPPANDSYTNQSTELNYRHSDLMTSTKAKLSGRTLTATMQHYRVDIVVNITDATTAALPAKATLKLKRMSGNTPEWITAWNSGTTDGTTTFRACVEVEDVPGNYSGTVPDNSLLGTLTYTPADGTPTKTLNIKYSIGGGTATTIKPGMRITINVPFVDLTTVTGTATVTDWNDTDGGEVGTIEGVALSTGLNDDPGLNNLTADNPTWIITGGTDANNTTEHTTVMTNLRNALNTAFNNNPKARINLMLTGFAGEINFTYDDSPIGCKALEYISAPAATSVVDISLYECTALTTVSLPAAKTIGDNALQGCTALTTLSLPAITKIGNAAFNGCTALTTISLPKAEIIMAGAFAHCTALTTISLPKAETIGPLAFLNCPKLTRLELTGTEPITVGVDAFYFINNNNDGAKNVTLVLNESIKDNEEKQKAIGLKIAEDGKTVTFLKAISGTDLTDITVTFAAIDYLSS